MPAIVSPFAHPTWSALGDRAQIRRTKLGYSQAKVARHIGISVRDYAAMESGFVPPHIHENLSKIKLAELDDILEWEKGTAVNTVVAVLQPTSSPGTVAFTPGDRSTYSPAAWARLGTAVQKARLALKMTKPVLGYAIQSTGKSILRIEEGRIHGDPRTAPAGDYNSEKYLLKRLSLLEMALEWDAGQARQILDGTNVSPTP
ncbi:helix-turn-helix domain-containing protein [Streptomyces sp. NPDC018055]|uniref:helix-turn-helix domain-containing protein n=1 Tax=Streptomyces sp. NPDC018055 TaxID=3365038 RepID=UPI0037A73916